MTRQSFFAAAAADYAENLNLDALVANVAAQHRRGMLSKPDVIAILRDAGCFEAEIAGAVA